MKGLLNLALGITIDVLIGLAAAWLFDVELTTALVGLLLIQTRLSDAVTAYLLKRELARSSGGERSEP